MIRINRPVAVPQSLEKKGRARTEEDCRNFDADPNAYLSGLKNFSVLENIYRTPLIKRTLMKAQHEKCCYCESKILPTGYGAVEHFRPKGGVRQDSNSREEKPGYYWLAYTWSNLVVSCSRCNTSHKKTLFPLLNPDHRARNHNDPIDNEEPMLVDPGAEDPRDHIRFRYDAPEPQTPRGKETICVLGLERSDLAEARLKMAKLIGLAKRVVELYEAVNAIEQRQMDQDQQKDIDETVIILENSIKPNAE